MQIENNLEKKEMDIEKKGNNLNSLSLEDIDPNLLIDITETMVKDFNLNSLPQIYQNKTKPSEFKRIANLAKGGFGEVYIVEKNGEYFAMKMMAKEQIQRNLYKTFFMNERNLLLKGDNVWSVRALQCIQDDIYIYFIMDFIPGGDLMNLFIGKNSTSEEEVRFYAAEAAYAIHKIHECGYIHRDIKPDNIFIKEDGHLILGDFGSSALMVNGKIKSRHPIGTPDYVCKDVLDIDSNDGYDETVDFWGLGVVLYELIMGDVPFSSLSLKETYNKITTLDYKKIQDIPDDLSDLINHLITDRANRLDWKGIKTHPFFKSIDWDNLLAMKPPFIPKIKSANDNSNFNSSSDFKSEIFKTKCGYKDYIGFTYDPDAVKRLNPIKSGDNLNEMLSLKMLEIEDLNFTISELQNEKSSKVDEVKQISKNLLNISTELITKRDELHSLNGIMLNKTKEIKQLDADISRKTSLLKSENKSDLVLIDSIRKLNNTINTLDYANTINDIKTKAYSLYKENERLKNQIDILNINVSQTNEDELKNQIRIYKADLKTYEQRIEDEIDMRRKLEIDIKLLKESLNKENNKINRTWHVIDGKNGKAIKIVLENSIFTIEEKEYLNGRVFIRELKNNEYHYFSERKRNLALVIHLLEETIINSDSSTFSRRSIKSIEEEYKKEKEVLFGLEQLAVIVPNESAGEIFTQIKNSKKKINYLKSEISRVMKQSMNENQLINEISEESDNLHEYNNHRFIQKIVGKGTLCECCNDIITGVFCNAYYCKECHYTVHDYCYLLVDYSCETKKAIDKGKTIVIVCKSLEEKESLFKAGK
ncbi:CTRO [Hepatospora eriocheir]|uniref:non-specific serine/threonine protein kinase n=1 Tax=Hepatospora eriocheir TaxID=1081669 RepID=A0A1X0QJ25_9MICR|nr:CTRO [Hepatospora eriocheir]